MGDGREVGLLTCGFHVSFYLVPHQRHAIQNHSQYFLENIFILVLKDKGYVISILWF